MPVKSVGPSDELFSEPGAHVVAAGVRVFDPQHVVGLTKQKTTLGNRSGRYQGTDVCVVDLATRKVTNLTDSPSEYDEPEGIFPDGKFTLVECDKQNKKGWQFIDIWKLRLEGKSYVERLTYFSDYPGCKASNPVVSDDGKFMAFQMARTTDPAGVGYGIFVYDLAKAGKRK